MVAPCPGAPTGTKCAAGTDYLWRLRPWDYKIGFGYTYGCCACRKTKASGPTTALYGPLSGVASGPYCTSTSEWHKTLPANTVVHFTGNVAYSYESWGCPKNDYAEIVLPDPVTPENWASFYVPLADLSHCNPQRACGGRAELGATCQGATGCCTVAAEGGHPDAMCYFPYNSNQAGDQGSACGIRPSAGSPIQAAHT